MNQFHDIAQQLLQQTTGQSQQTVGTTLSAQDLLGLRKFLKTAPGREAARASVDNIVIKSKNPQMAQSIVPHQDIMRSLVYSMQQAGKTIPMTAPNSGAGGGGVAQAAVPDPSMSELTPPNIPGLT